MKWIPITEKLPTPGSCVIVTIYDSFRNRRELRYPVTYRESYYTDSYGFYQYGTEENYLMPEYSEVIAWMPIPDVYDGDLEENNEKM
jgi:hypothetical protein